jgi:hypothetical protein
MIYLTVGVWIPEEPFIPLRFAIKACLRYGRQRWIINSRPSRGAPFNRVGGESLRDRPRHVLVIRFFQNVLTLLCFSRAFLRNFLQPQQSVSS